LVRRIYKYEEGRGIMILSLIKITDGKPEDTGISRETLGAGIILDNCTSCGGKIDITGFHGKILQDYLEYRYEGGEECPPCYTGSTVDREKPMNRQEWLKGP